MSDILRRELLTVAEVAAVLGYSETRVYDSVRRGDFPIQSVELWEGAHLRFRRIDVEAFVGRAARRAS